MVFDGELSIGIHAFAEKVVCDLDLGTHDLQNGIIAIWQFDNKYNFNKLH